MTPPARSHRLACLGGELPEYAAGRLPDARMRVWDRHLVSCIGCAQAVAEERRLQAVLAEGIPSLPASLHGALLAMSAHSQTSGGQVPPTSSPLPPVRPLLTLAPTAPPCHRSVLRSAVIAAVAASAGAAAAWSLGVSGSVPNVIVTRPVAGSPATQPSGGGSAASGLAEAGWTGVVVSFLGPATPTVEPRGVRRAQSTP